MSMKAVKIEAWKFYDKWRNKPPYSPALKATIRISRKGWNHLTGAAGYKKRVVGDVYRRLKLLPYADEIIKTSTTIQNIVTKKKIKYYALEAVVEVEQDGKKSLRKIRVIIQQDKSGQFIFFSVMDKKRRRRKKN